jgi:hypothetical protein
MGLNEDQRRELNRDGKVEILSINSSEHGSHVLFSRVQSNLGVPDRVVVRSAFFGKDGNTVYNMIVSNNRV